MLKMCNLKVINLLHFYYFQSADKFYLFLLDFLNYSALTFLSITFAEIKLFADTLNRI